VVLGVRGVGAVAGPRGGGGGGLCVRLKYQYLGLGGSRRAKYHFY